MVGVMQSVLVIEPPSVEKGLQLARLSTPRSLEAQIVRQLRRTVSYVTHIHVGVAHTSIAE